MRSSSLSTCSLLLFLVLQAGCGAQTSLLQSIRVASAPTIDGQANDEQWKTAPAMTVQVSTEGNYTPEGSPNGPSYPGFTSTTVTMKSVYTDSEVFFLIRWDDQDESLQRYPWIRAKNGTWSQQYNRDSSGHENTYYEDKFAIQWDINTRGFEGQGCRASCHEAAKGSALYPGKKYNAYPGDISDMWHWKSVRTHPNQQLDDKHVVYQDPLSEKPNGRTADSKTAGGYSDNNFEGFGEECVADPTGEKNRPCFMGPDGKEGLQVGKTWLLESEKQPFEDTFKAGDEVAAIVTSPFVGSRGDVTADAKHVDGSWTLEIKRNLKTKSGNTEDVQFEDLSKAYNFGIAVFDNTQINHAMHEGVKTLEFVN